MTPSSLAPLPEDSASSKGQVELQPVAVPEASNPRANRFNRIKAMM